MTDESQPSEWLTVEDVARLFKLSRNTVYRRIRVGDWDAFISKLGKTLVRRDGLEQWLRAGGDLQRDAEWRARREGVAQREAPSSLAPGAKRPKFRVIP